MAVCVEIKGPALLSPPLFFDIGYFFEKKQEVQNEILRFKKTNSQSL